MTTGRINQVPIVARPACPAGHDLPGTPRGTGDRWVTQRERHARCVARPARRRPRKAVAPRGPSGHSSYPHGVPQRQVRRTGPRPPRRGGSDGVACGLQEEAVGRLTHEISSENSGRGVDGPPGHCGRCLASGHASTAPHGPRGKTPREFGTLYAGVAPGLRRQTRATTGGRERTRHPCRSLRGSLLRARRQELGLERAGRSGAVRCRAGGSDPAQRPRRKRGTGDEEAPEGRPNGSALAPRPKAVAWLSHRAQPARGDRPGGTARAPGERGCPGGEPRAGVH